MYLIVQNDSEYFHFQILEFPSASGLYSEYKAFLLDAKGLGTAPYNNYAPP